MKVNVAPGALTTVDFLYLLAHVFNLIIFKYKICPQSLNTDGTYMSTKIDILCFQ